MIIDAVKVFIPATFAFIIGILLTPILSGYLYRNEMWKKKAKTIAPDGRATPIFNSLHADRETKVPRMGGILIWASVIITTIIVSLIAYIAPGEITSKLDFLTRNQTWIPLATLFVGAIIGLIDDIMDIQGEGSYIAGGLSLSKRIMLVSIIGFLASLWFYFKLEVNNIGIPFSEDFYIGWFFIPLFVLVMAAIYSGGVIDGIDGLAGGVFATMFGAYGIISFYQNQINLSAFCFTVVGALLAFLWFNIPPARFYMSETGSMALTLAITIVAFMTDFLGEGVGLFVLPIIGLPLVVTTLSVIIQLFSKKFRDGKKVFLVAPIHHHFEAKGWPPYKVTMRYWVVSIMCAIGGITIALLG